MIAPFYLILISVATLTISVFLLKHAVRRSSEGGVHWTEEDVSVAPNEDTFAVEIGARIFNPEDMDFVSGETSRQFASRFREERTALALGWLRGVRRQVSRLVRDYRLTARGNPDLKPTGELRILFEFLLFQLTSGILYCVVWVHGPLHAARLLEWSRALTGELRKIAEDAIPVAISATVEIIETDAHVINRS